MRFPGAFSKFAIIRAFSPESGHRFGAENATNVLNAGANLRRRAADVTPEEWDAVIATNLTGTFFLSQQFGRHLIAGGRPGSIVNIASTHGLVGAAERSTYGISKAA